MVHWAADPRTHGGEASHREVGHIPRLKEKKKAAVSLEQLRFNEEEMEQEDREECSPPSQLLS